MSARILKKRSQAFANTYSLYECLSHARPSFYALSPRQQKHVLCRVLADRRVLPNGDHKGLGLPRRVAKRIARAHYRTLIAEATP